MGIALTVPTIKDAAKRNYRHFSKYVLVGGSTFVVDLGLLVALHQLGQVPVIWAATISYWVSIMFNFALNRHWTFETTRSLHRHAVAYGALLAVNYAVTIGVIAGLGLLGVTYTLAKVAAVGLSMTWTYWVYKHVIFV